MKQALIMALACLILCPVMAAAQTRSRTTSSNPQRRTRPSSGSAAAPGGEVGAGADRVAEQIKSLAQFLYLYGPISRELASNEAASSQTGGAPSETVQRNKAKLQDAFRNYKARMDELETMFSSSSDLRRFYPKLLGVADAAATAEEQVAANRYDQAGRYLLEVLNRLTDVLAGMR